jgi:hypothetical protein
VSGYASKSKSYLGLDLLFSGELHIVSMIRDSQTGGKYLRVVDEGTAYLGVRR